ncbi:hypothetical protein [Xanthobacter sp. 126]|jgi:hypothetical protein|uniref:hypothetical protein n=1 Tax=Xanthobacter sp. 126 TaxID=1131814 RepID=UPI00045EC1C3
MADDLKNRRAVLKATGALGTIAALEVPVVILPKEAEAAALINSPVPALWARWRAIKPEYTRLAAEAEAVRDRYLAAEPALPREAYAGPQHFGLGVIFLDSTPSGQLMRWGMASHWRSVASACDGDEHSHWVPIEAFNRAEQRAKTLRIRDGCAMRHGRRSKCTLEHIGRVVLGTGSGNGVSEDATDRRAQALCRLVISSFVDRSQDFEHFGSGDVRDRTCP